MNDNKIAVISDIHGNSWALKAVLEDIRNRRIGEIVNLGDCVYGPLDPKGTLDILMNSNIISVSGNEDDVLFQNSGKYDQTVHYVRDNLSRQHLAWLEDLPEKLTINNELLIFHGSIESKQNYLLVKVMEKSIVYRSDPELTRKTDNVSEKILLCGHSHLPDLKRLSNGKLILNPGSVGLQAFTDDIPYYHFIENGSPHARYAIIKKRDERWSVEKVEISYDWESASRRALKNGRNDWAEWLRTGTVSRTLMGKVS